MPLTNDYCQNPKGLFARATQGRIVQALALKKLRGILRTQFTTAHVGATHGHYYVALNIPIWAYCTLWWKKKDLELVMLEWIREYDPEAEDVRIQRTSKGLEKAQVALF
jgi:hypothetical protein